MIELGNNRTHAVITQAASMARRGHESAAQRIHFGERCNFSTVAEIIHEFTARQRRTARRFDPDKFDIIFALDLITHKRSNQPAEVRTAADTANDDIRPDTVFFHRGLTLKSND